MCDQCDCAHVPDHGACDVFDQGMNGRCVYCDHDEGCHPGHGQFHNGPLASVERVAPPDSPTWPGCRWCGEPVMMYPFGPNEGQPARVCKRCMLEGVARLLTTVTFAPYGRPWQKPRQHRVGVDAQVSMSDKGCCRT